LARLYSAARLDANRIPAALRQFQGISIDAGEITEIRAPMWKFRHRRVKNL
jgi:hypothetical protein